MPQGEMYDVGVSAEKSGMQPSKLVKNKKYYPSLYLEKDVGDFKIGQNLLLVVGARVTALRKDESGVRTTFEVRKLGIKKNMTKESVGMKLAGGILKEKED